VTDAVTRFEKVAIGSQRLQRERLITSACERADPDALPAFQRHGRSRHVGAAARPRSRRAALPRCGATLRILAAIEDPAIARRLFECMGLPARAPPVAPAPSSDPACDSEVNECWDFEQTAPSEDP